MTRTLTILCLIAAILIIAGCGGSAAYRPVLESGHLPEALRPLKLGATNMDQARALFPASDTLSIREGNDKTMGGERDWIAKRGPNEGVHYNRMEVVRVQRDGTFLSDLGEDYQWINYRFAPVKSGEPAVLYYLSVNQLPPGSKLSRHPEETFTHICEAASELASDPHAVEGCPEGVTPVAGDDPERFTLCVGSPDGQHPVVITCRSRQLDIEMIVPHESEAEAEE